MNTPNIFSFLSITVVQMEERTLDSWLNDIDSLSELEKKGLKAFYENTGISTEGKERYLLEMLSSDGLSFGSATESKLAVWKAIDDMKDIIRKTGTLTITIDVQNGSPITMKGNFKEKRLDRYEELKEYTADYGFVANKKHGYSTAIIVGEKDFKY